MCFYECDAEPDIFVRKKGNIAETKGFPVSQRGLR